MNERCIGKGRIPFLAFQYRLSGLVRIGRLHRASSVWVPRKLIFRLRLPCALSTKPDFLGAMIPRLRLN